MDGAVFALLGLLIAFTFSGATSRFDERRNLIVEETNDVGTAYLRLDLLPASTQPALRELFREYLDARLDTYQKMPDLNAAKAAFDRSIELQEDIWRHAVAAAAMPEVPVAANTLLLPALNQMFDITNTRTGGNEAASAAGDFRAAVRNGVDFGTACRLRHGPWHIPQLDSYYWFYPHHGAGSEHHHQHRVSAEEA